jgi:hypothetical protein
LRDAAIRWAERRHKVTVKASLQSFLVAFLLGIWARVDARRPSLYN